MKRLLTLGCSNSSELYGKSWPDYLSSSLGYNLFRASSPGAGNSFYLEKLHEGIKEINPDLVVIQLTEPSRIVTGMFEVDSSKDFGYTNGNYFKDISNYTWNAHSNEGNLEGYNISIDEFWSRNVSTSRWVDYKVMQDVFYMYSICKYFGVKVIFWSWFVNFEDLFVDSYEWLKDEILWIDGFATDKMSKFEQPRISPTDSHFGSKPHEILVKKWLLPEVLKFYNE